MSLAGLGSYQLVSNYELAEGNASSQIDRYFVTICRPTCAGDINVVTASSFK